MKIANFEAAGLARVAEYIASSPHLWTEVTLREILKGVNISFVLEGINRLQSMLFCELKDSYVQQSQRYVQAAADGYTLPDLDASDSARGEDLIQQALGLYEEMTVVKAAFKGRPKAAYYQYGIAIEDGRYILPLAMKTNVSTAMSGDKLLDWWRLMQDKRYGDIFAEMREALRALLPPALAEALAQVVFAYPDERVSGFYQDALAQLTPEAPVQYLGGFADLPLKAGLGAITSTSAQTPSQVLAHWGADASERAAKVAERVMGYGHFSVIEQARTTFGLRFSLVTYHQQERHRLPANYREDLQAIIDERRPPIVPESIAKSPFYARFLALVQDFAAFRAHLSAKYSNKAQYYFLLNCDAIKLISSTNARMDCEMLKERICNNAQWEIRQISVRKLAILRALAPELYQNALPSCVYGACKEGQYTCGKAAEMRLKYGKAKGSEGNG